MIKPAGQIEPVEASRGDRVKASTPVAAVAVSASGTRATDAAAQGPPLDVVRIGQIRAALAAGAYRVDSRAIAEAMIAQDLPGPSE